MTENWKLNDASIARLESDRAARKVGGGRKRPMSRKGLSMIRVARHLRRRTKQVLMLLCDLIAIPAALWTAISLRDGAPATLTPDIAWIYGTVLLATIPVFVKTGLYRAVIRFAGIDVARLIALGVGFSTVVLLITNYLAETPMRWSAIIIYAALALVYVGASRFIARETLRIKPTSTSRVIIYGAGAAGAQLCSSLATAGHFRPVALVDDTQSPCTADGSAGSRFSIRRCPARAAPPHGTGLVLLALPSATRRRRSEIIETG